MKRLVVTFKEEYEMATIAVQPKKGSRLGGQKFARVDQTLITEERIRCRAYEIYLAHATKPGDPLRDWLQAERELTAQHVRNQPR